MKKWLLFIFASLVLYSNYFIVQYILAKTGARFYQGKDDGLVFSAFCICIFSTIFFFIISRKLKAIALGFFIGIVCNLLLGLLYMVEASIIPDNSGPYLSMEGDHLLVTTFVFICGYVYFTWNNRVAGKS